MARARKGGAIQSKIAALVWGEQGTGKSTLALQSMYLKRPDGKDFRVLYLDAESGSVDDYTDNLWADGLKEDNLYIVYTQSLSEVRDYINRATNHEPFYMLDENGEETDEMVLDADGEMFNPDMIILDGSSVLYMTSQQSLINFSKKRAGVRAKKKELLGDERTVSVESAALEMKDYGTLKFLGQDLVLDLTACGKHYIITAREKDETKTVEKKDITGNTVTVSVATGRKLPDSFGNAMSYNVKTELHLYRDSNNPDVVNAFVIKDRTQVHAPGETIEDPSILDWQKIIDRTANNKEYIVKNNLTKSAKVEEENYTKSMDKYLDDEPVVEDEPKTTEKTESITDIISDLMNRKNNLSAMKKQEFKAALENAGLPTAFKSIKDIGVAKAILAELNKIA